MANSTKKSVRTGIFLVTYNRTDILEKALQSIQHSDQIDQFNVFIIDNASKIDIKPIISKFKTFTYIRRDKNYLVAQALNDAFFEYYKKNSYEYAIFIADDVKVEKKTFVNIVSFFDTHPDVGFTAPLHLEYNTTIVRTKGLGINHYTSLLTNCLDTNCYDKVNHFISCYAVRSHIFAKIKGYDATLFPMIYEEPDLGERIKQIGWKLAPCENSRMWHPIELETREKNTITVRKERLHNSQTKMYFFFRNRIIYMAIHSNVFQFLFFYLLINPCISLYYLYSARFSYLGSAISGFIDGSYFALTKNRQYITMRNQIIIDQQT